MRSPQELRQRLEQINAEYIRAINIVNDMYGSQNDIEYAKARLHMQSLQQQVALLEWALS